MSGEWSKYYVEPDRSRVADMVRILRYDHQQAKRAREDRGKQKKGGKIRADLKQAVEAEYLAEEAVKRDPNNNTLKKFYSNGEECVDSESDSDIPGALDDALLVPPWQQDGHQYIGKCVITLQPDPDDVLSKLRPVRAGLSLCLSVCSLSLSLFVSLCPHICLCLSVRGMV